MKSVDERVRELLPCGEIRISDDSSGCGGGNHSWMCLASARPRATALLSDYVSAIREARERIAYFKSMLECDICRQCPMLCSAHSGHIELEFVVETLAKLDALCADGEST